ncbi:hypothetical protein L1277_001603 [Okibacterium sp. HSC-33S16]|nr:hypothetical protein [Okibacterium sp. HSC-33S16]
MCGEPDTDVGDEVRPVRRTFLNDVENVPAVHHGEVRTLPHLVDELGEQWVSESAQRLLASESAGELEGGHPQSVPASLRQVHNEPALLQDTEQVVHGRPRQVERGRQGGSGHRATLGGEMTEDAQGGIRCGNLLSSHSIPLFRGARRLESQTRASPTPLLLDPVTGRIET